MNQVINGVTVFTPSPDTRKVYVSPTGNDANNGLSESTPKRSIAAGYAQLRDGFPDWLLLQKGGTWTERFPSWSKQGRSAQEKMLIASYGTGAWPLIKCGNGGGFNAGQFSGPVKGHLALTDMNFIADGNTGSNSSAGVEFLGSWSDVLLENCQVERFHTNLVFQSDRTVQTMEDISIRNCGVFDAFTTGSSHAEGCYLAGINRLLLEDCVFDHNGWNEQIPGAVPTIFRHNIYIQGHAGNYDDCTNVTTRGLISARAGATGMQQRPGGPCEDCLFIQNPLNLVFGTEGGMIRRVVAYDSRDIDAANPRGVGFNLVDATPGAVTQMEDCLAMIRSVNGTANIAAYSPDKLLNPLRMTRCYDYNWRSPNGVGVSLDIRGGSPQPILTSCNLRDKPGYVNPANPRTLATFLTSLGIAPGTDAVATFMSYARKRDPRFKASSVRLHLMGMWGVVPQYWTDFNHNGVLDVDDFNVFLAKYAAGDMSADANNDGKLNVADFTAFLTRRAQEQAGIITGDARIAAA